MPEIKITKTAVLATACLLSLLVLPGAVQADPEHVVSVKIEFVDDPGCADTTISISAASCDPAEIASELESKLVDLGFGFALCLFTPLYDEWECAWIEPTGCDQEDIEVSTLVGTGCTTNSVRVSYSASSGGVGQFEFDIK